MARPLAHLDLAGPLLDATPALVVVLAADGTVARVNRRACEVLGHAEGDLVGADWIELTVPVGERGDARHTFERAMLDHDEHDERFEATVLDREGRARLVAWTSVLLHDDAGAVAGVLRSGELLGPTATGHDDLTGLPGRPLLEAHLQLAVARARRQDREVAVLLVDLDGFGQVNDAFGRATGDEVLRQTALRLREVTRAHDVLARTGGDELGLVLADLEQGAAESAVVIGRLIRDSLAQPFRVDDIDFHLGASIGVGLFPDHADNAADLLHRAAVALRKAKRP